MNHIFHEDYLIQCLAQFFTDKRDKRSKEEKHSAMALFLLHQHPQFILQKFVCGREKCIEHVLLHPHSVVYASVPNHLLHRMQFLGGRANFRLHHANNHPCIRYFDDTIGFAIPLEVIEYPLDRIESMFGKFVHSEEGLLKHGNSASKSPLEGAMIEWVRGIDRDRPGYIDQFRNNTRTEPSQVESEWASEKRSTHDDYLQCEKDNSEILHEEEIVQTPPPSPTRRDSAKDLISWVGNYVKKLRESGVHITISQQNVMISLLADPSLMQLNELLHRPDDEAAGTSSGQSLIFDFDMTEQMSPRAMLKLGAQRRNKSYQEATAAFLSEERAYLRELNMLVNVFLRRFELIRLKEDNSYMEDIFGNITELHELSRKLERAIEDARELNDPFSAGAGLWELAEANEFDAYHQYVKHISCGTYLDTIAKVLTVRKYASTFEVEAKPYTRQREGTGSGASSYAASSASAVATSASFYLAVRYVLHQLLLVPIVHFFKYVEHTTRLHSMSQNDDDRGDLQNTRNTLTALAVRIEKTCAMNGTIQKRMKLEQSTRIAADSAPGAGTSFDRILEATELDLNAKNYAGHARLHLDALKGEIRLIITLASYRCNVDERDSNGNTALHIPVSKNDLKVTRLLLCLGADPNVKNSSGDAPRNLAARLKHNDMLRSLCGTALCEISKLGCVSGCVSNEMLARIKSGSTITDDLSSPRSSMLNGLEDEEAKLLIGKKMYDDGDDEMKRTIRKAWHESQSKMEGLGMDM